MTGWAALLRAVNVGGTGKLPMAELRALCEELGLARVQTYIASGNVVFASDRDPAGLRGLIEDALEARYGKRIVVLVRSAAQLAEIVAANPWPDRPGNRVFVLFTDEAPSLEGVRHQAGEELAVAAGAIYAFYPEIAGPSRLVIPASRAGTMRNMNTVRKLMELTSAL